MNATIRITSELKYFRKLAKEKVVKHLIQFGATMMT